MWISDKKYADPHFFVYIQTYMDYNRICSTNLKKGEKVYEN